MNIRCAHCKNRHETVEQVRNCATGADAPEEMTYMGAAHGVKEYATTEGPDLMDALRRSQNAVQEIGLSEEERAAARLDAMTGTPGRDMASPRQVAYVMDLLRQYEWPDHLTEDDVKNMERRQVTKLIDGLKASKRRTALPTQSDWVRFKSIPAGRYCLDFDDGLKFFQLDRPDRGQWAGKMFLSVLVGAPGDYRKIKIAAGPRIKVLEMIAKDPREASIRYGKESRECGVCHSPLTNQASLDRGIGPVCAGKRGW